MEAMRHAKALRHEFNLFHIVKDPKNGPGLWTDSGTKYTYGEKLREALVYNRLVWMQDFICLGDNITARREELMKNFYTELGNVQKVIKLSNDPMRPPKIGWSGKLGYDGKRVEGQNDDCAVVAGICTKVIWEIMNKGPPNVWTLF